jgi:hypothetical protein
MTTPKISKEVEDLLTPDRMHDKADDSVVPSPPRKPDPAKTQKELERLLCPDDLRDKPDDPDLKPDPTGLVPDWAREKKGEDEEDELKPAKEKTPIADQKETGMTLGEWVEKQAKIKEDIAEKESKAAEKERLAVERENEEIRKSFRRVSAKMKADDLTDDLVPDNLK